MTTSKDPAAVSLGRRGGKVGGKATGGKKAKAARENGKLGGRPPDEEKKEVIEWLLQHLPGGPEMHLDNLSRIAMSLQARPLSWLLELKAARQKVEAGL